MPSIDKQTQKIGMKSGVIAVTVPDHVVYELWKLAWKVLKMWTREVLQCHEQNLIDSQIPEDQNADRNAGSKGHIQEASAGNK